jgi:hypothetical protein
VVRRWRDKGSWDTAIVVALQCQKEEEEEWDDSARFTLMIDSRRDTLAASEVHLEETTPFGHRGVDDDDE